MGMERLRTSRESNPETPIRRFELVDALTEGSNATAKVRTYSRVTEEYETTTEEFEVYDADGVFAGAPGDKGKAIWMPDSRRWEVIALSVGLKVAVLDGDLAAGGSATASLYTADAGTESDSGVNVTVYDFIIPSGKELVSGSKIFVGLVDGFWYLVNTGICPTTP